MKKFSKILSVALLVALVLSLGVANAFADGGTYTIAITNDAEGYSYSAYQIFKGDLSNDKKTLSNIEWGSGVTDAGKDALYSRYGLTATADQTAAKVAEKIATDNAPNPADEIATLLAKTTDDALANPITMSKDGNAYKTAPQVPGYYMVVNTGIPNGSNAAYSDYIVEVVANVNIAPKADVPSSEKKVKDINDSNTTGYTDWQDAADYDIGDEISFKLTATIPATVRLNDFTHYTLKFVDTMSKGLTYKNDSAVIKVNGTTIKTMNPGSVPTTDTEGKYVGGNVLTWDLGDIKAAPYNVTANEDGNVVTIEYIATINSNAVVGVNGNPNKMHIEFSNNPNNESDKGTTTDDVNIVFTYKLVVDKINSEKEDLTGAGFTLYKKNSSGEYVAVTDEVKGDQMTQFSWNGLDDGDYKLVETTTPDGFNTIDPIEFTVTAEHSITSQDPALTSLSVTEGKGLTASLNGGELSRQKDNTTHTAGSGEVYGEIQNNSGATLPSTGGIGTTIFYVVGGVLVLAAIILLVTKKRMSE